MSHTHSNTARDIVRTLADIERIESTPWQEVIPAQDTWHLLRAACERWPERIALRLLLAARADAPTRDFRYSDLLEGVRRTANALHALRRRAGCRGVDPAAQRDRGPSRLMGRAGRRHCEPDQPNARIGVHRAHLRGNAVAGGRRLRSRRRIRHVGQGCGGGRQGAEHPYLAAGRSGSRVRLSTGRWATPAARHHAATARRARARLPRCAGAGRGDAACRRAPLRSERALRLLPHRWHDGLPEGGHAHPSQRSLHGLGPGEVLRR